MLMFNNSMMQPNFSQNVINSNVHNISPTVGLNSAVQHGNVFNNTQQQMSPSSTPSLQTFWGTIPVANTTIQGFPMNFASPTMPGSFMHPVAGAENQMTTVNVQQPTVGQQNTVQIPQPTGYEMHMDMAEPKNNVQQPVYDSGQPMQQNSPQMPQMIQYNPYIVGRRIQGMDGNFYNVITNAATPPPQLITTPPMQVNPFGGDVTMTTGSVDSGTPSTSSHVEQIVPGAFNPATITSNGSSPTMEFVAGKPANQQQFTNFVNMPTSTTGFTFPSNSPMNDPTKVFLQRSPSPSVNNNQNDLSASPEYGEGHRDRSRSVANRIPPGFEGGSYHVHREAQHLTVPNRYTPRND